MCKEKKKEKQHLHQSEGAWSKKKITIFSDFFRCFPFFCVYRAPICHCAIRLKETRICRDVAVSDESLKIKQKYDEKWWKTACLHIGLQVPFRKHRVELILFLLCVCLSLPLSLTHLDMYIQYELNYNEMEWLEFIRGIDDFSSIWKNAN